ncbi:NAD kinase isoform X1 [Sapajus apella]|uniref:NAD kinase n=1 Tax=Sapajus apella TaxID=9515 RepID=A0A6J3GJ21_SAPAP|nr:NAD kinase isoform X1 [Sapajus apella]
MPVIPALEWPRRAGSQASVPPPSGSRGHHLLHGRTMRKGPVLPCEGCWATCQKATWPCEVGRPPHGTSLTGARAVCASPALWKLVTHRGMRPQPWAVTEGQVWRNLFCSLLGCHKVRSGEASDSACTGHIQDPASQRLTWNKAPKSVLVIKKMRDASLLQPFKELCTYLMEENNMIVYVEKKVLEDPAIASDESFGAVKKKFCTFREDYDDISNRIDFIICLGGDGTLLYASSLFQGSVPPVMAFHLGSLGFLTPFSFENFQSQVTQVIEGNAAVVLRSRLKVRVVKELREKKTAVHNGLGENGSRPVGLDMDVEKQAMQYQVLNEVVIDRGPSSYLSNVDVYLDGHLITTVQGDGVIVSTPTGSTAYAAAAGASMIHPNVPAIMITPICPHSLSFRPIVVPAGVELKIMLSPEARNTAWVSFDGRKRQEIRHGDSISITTSCYPLPSICVRDPVSDWFESLAQCLHWNVRKKQAHFEEEEEEEEEEEG